MPKVFNWRVLDCDLAIGLCTLLSKTEVFPLLWKLVDNTWQNYDKIMVGVGPTSPLLIGSLVVMYKTFPGL